MTRSVLTAAALTSSRGPSPTRLLVVEDDPDLREVLADVLRETGYEVAEAGNGLDALEHLRRAPARPDLIVLDLMMPVMDGWTFRETQLADDALAAIPVIVVSAVEPGTLSVDARLAKPFRVEELLAAIPRVLRRR